MKYWLIVITKNYDNKLCLIPLFSKYNKEEIIRLKNKIKKYIYYINFYIINTNKKYIKFYENDIICGYNTERFENKKNCYLLKMTDIFDFYEYDYLYSDWKNLKKLYENEFGVQIIY
uniref:Uncharacterized protein n=1 Tax=Pithovirus LCDPAC02 TaxID=2506601 RepID=A0A481YP34_9VIRU|nr:MAG: hypothetical protein LCDPAC02_00590 [Pithovirus LCDPAC02]